MHRRPDPRPTAWCWTSWRSARLATLPAGVSKSCVRGDQQETMSQVMGVTWTGEVKISRVETRRPRLADAQRPAADRVRNLMLSPLAGDKRGHGYRPIASATQTETLPFRTSHRIRTSADYLRGRTRYA